MFPNQKIPIDLGEHFPTVVPTVQHIYIYFLTTLIYIRLLQIKSHYPCDRNFNWKSNLLQTRTGRQHIKWINGKFDHVQRKTTHTCFSTIVKPPFFPFFHFLYVHIEHLFLFLTFHHNILTIDTVCRHALLRLYVVLQNPFEFMLSV